MNYDLNLNTKAYSAAKGKFIAKYGVDKWWTSKEKLKALYGSIKDKPEYWDLKNNTIKVEGY